MFIKFLLKKFHQIHIDKLSFGCVLQSICMNLQPKIVQMDRFRDGETNEHQNVNK